jgi:carboxyl-terminal processing protease
MIVTFVAGSLPIRGKLFLSVSTTFIPIIMTRITQKYLPVLLAGMLLFSACKKDKPDEVDPPPPAGGGGGSTVTFNPELLKDTALMYSRDIYFWNAQIPATFNARSHADPAALMTAIRPYSNEPGFGTPVDRWSFAMKKTEWELVSGGMGALIGGTTQQDGDFGLSVFFRVEGDLRVRMVEPNSPAGRAGIRRGWRITKINGTGNLTTANSSTIIENVYNATSTSFEFTKPDGTTQTTTLTAAIYTEKPVYMDTVYTVDNKKIGYLVFNSFLGNQQNISAEFDRVFSKFANAQITDLVVDLRYNGGGYVSLAEKLANYLVPSGSNGGIMMKQVYNAQNSQHNETTYMQKTGSLELSKVYFIVTRSTASASELLINTLKPYMDVRVLGPTNTHGKPVGFFPISVGDWYVFPVSFKTTNKNGEGSYFSGLPVNAVIADGLDKDWGDVTESSLASAIKNITTGAYMRAVTEFAGPSPAVENSNEKLDDPFLKVTIGKGF